MDRIQTLKHLTVGEKGRYTNDEKVFKRHKKYVCGLFQSFKILPNWCIITWIMDINSFPESFVLILPVNMLHLSPLVYLLDKHGVCVKYGSVSSCPLLAQPSQPQVVSFHCTPFRFKFLKIKHFYYVFHSYKDSACTNNEINSKKSQNLYVFFSCRWGATHRKLTTSPFAPQILF